MPEQNAGSARFVVRTRADGWAVVDTVGLLLESRPPSKARAERRAQTLNEEDENARTYAVVWYCEVDAVSEQAAVKRARKFLAAGYRDNWEPLSVAVVGQTRGREKEEP